MVSQPGTDWNGRRGYIHEHFDAARLSAEPFDMYLCGPPPMVEAVKGWVADQAPGEVQIYAEKFLQSATTRR